MMTPVIAEHTVTGPGKTLIFVKFESVQGSIKGHTSLHGDSLTPTLRAAHRLLSASRFLGGGLDDETACGAFRACL
eukprot:SAG11_NODE_98_length_16927_cov_35.166211_10_plen_76_part_00